MKSLLLVILSVAYGAGVCAAQARKVGAAAGGKNVGELLVSYERAEWEAVKRKEFEKFGSFLAEDFYDVFPNGQAVTKAELLRDYIRGVDLIDYSLSGFKVVMLNRDAAILVYEARARGRENQRSARAETEGGGEVSIHVAVTSGWALRGGRWLNVFYRENELK